MITCLTDESLLVFSGKDAGNFLQGQCTCDVLRLNGCSLGSFCNPKGRVISLFRIFKHEDKFYLILPKALAEILHKHLSKYILRSDVKIEKLDDSWKVYGLIGDSFDLGFDLPIDLNQVSVFINGFAINGTFTLQTQPLPQSEKRRFMLISNDWRPEFIGDIDEWLLEEIKAGIPSISETTSETFVPQMLNLDLLGGISFDKGCYTGQEVVARTHYLGNLKRRLYRLESKGEQRPSPGDSIYQADQAIGSIVNAAPDKEGFQILAVLNIEHLQTDLFWISGSGSRHFIQEEGSEKHKAP